MTLKMLFSDPCCDSQQIFSPFFLGSPSYQTQLSKLSIRSKVNLEMVSKLQNHCSHNAKANSKDNSENGLLCSLLRHSTHFF